MTDQVFNRAQLAVAVGNDIADMAYFWMLRKFQFLEPARTVRDYRRSVAQLLRGAFAKRNHGLQHGVYRLAAV